MVTTRYLVLLVSLVACTPEPLDLRVGQDESAADLLVGTWERRSPEGELMQVVHLKANGVYTDVSWRTNGTPLWSHRGTYRSERRAVDVDDFVRPEDGADVELNVLVFDIISSSDSLWRNRRMEMGYSVGRERLTLAPYMAIPYEDEVYFSYCAETSNTTNQYYDDPDPMTPLLILGPNDEFRLDDGDYEQIWYDHYRYRVQRERGRFAREGDRLTMRGDPPYLEIIPEWTLRFEGEAAVNERLKYVNSIECGWMSPGGHDGVAYERELETVVP